MTDQPTTQAINRAPPSLPTRTSRYGLALGAGGGLAYGIYKGHKVAGCAEVFKRGVSVSQSTDAVPYAVACAKCFICSSISLGGFVVAGCLGAVALGSIGYACAKPQQREAFRQDLTTGQFMDIMSCEDCNRDNAHRDSQATTNNPTVDPTDDQPLATIDHSANIIVDQPMPAPPPYDDLFPPPYDETIRAPDHQDGQPHQPSGSANPPSYDEAVRAPDHQDGQSHQPQGSANLSTPNT